MPLKELPVFQDIEVCIADTYPTEPHPLASHLSENPSHMSSLSQTFAFSADYQQSLNLSLLDVETASDTEMLDDKAMIFASHDNVSKQIETSSNIKENFVQDDLIGQNDQIVARPINISPAPGCGLLNEGVVIYLY